MPISPRICKSDRHSCSCSFVYSVREISTATWVPSLEFRSETTPILTNLGTERATHCYIVHYARAELRTLRRTCLADSVRMARRFVFERRQGAGTAGVRDPDPATDLPVRLH